jgi:DNA polymerase-3 subunit alpha
MYLIFDTETTGLPRNKNAPLSDFDNWPRLVQLAWQLHDGKGNLLSQQNFIIKPEGFDIPFKAEQVHGISTSRAIEEGHDLKSVLAHFSSDVEKTEVLVGHNIEFDISIIGAELLRSLLSTERFLSLQKVDTGLSSIEFCQLAGGVGGKLKMPRLSELYEKLFGENFQDAHDAAYDVDATAKAFFGLLERNVLTPYDSTDIHDIVYEPPQLDASNSTKRAKAKAKGIDYGNAQETQLTDKPFVHLHVHSQYSVLQAVPDVAELVAKAKANNMESLALTDFGNMYGASNLLARH